MLPQTINNKFYRFFSTQEETQVEEIQGMERELQRARGEKITDLKWEI